MAGDHKSGLDQDFARVLTVHGRALDRLCAAYLPDAFDRQDLFQEIAIAIWTALPRFRAEASERTWLYRIAHNVALTFVAKRRRQLSQEQPLDDAMCSPAGPGNSRRFALLESVRQLGPVDRQLVLLYLEGLSAREIEEVTGLTANNIGVRLLRLRRKLATAVQRKEVGG